MYLSSVLPALMAVAAVAAIASPGAQTVATYTVERPSLDIYECPQWTIFTYSLSVPDRSSFPLTEVGLCYDQTPGALHINFTAHDEKYFFYDESMGTNDPLYEYEVMETFISKGTNDPQTYLEFEVSPNNVTWQAFIYNPSKVRATNATFTNFMIDDPFAVGFTARTTLDTAAGVWNSLVHIPLGLFNVDQGEATGTEWRMNFFRIVESAESYPNQTLGAWNPPDQANFHMTPFFGDVKFV